MIFVLFIAALVGGCAMTLAHWGREWQIEDRIEKIAILFYEFCVGSYAALTESGS